MVRDGSLEDARPSLARAFQHGGMPYEAVPHLAEYVVYQLTHLWGVKDPRADLDTLLPDFFQACPDTSVVRQVKHQVHRVRAWQAYARNDRKEVRRFAFQALTTSPQAWRDRGLLSIWVRAVLGMPLTRTLSS